MSFSVYLSSMPHSGRLFILLAGLLLFSIRTHSQLQYELSYKDTASGLVQVRISFKMPAEKGFTFCMPRSVPGAYSILSYDKYVRNVRSVDAGGRYYKMSLNADNAPKWYAEKGTAFSGMVYEVDIRRMQYDLGSDASVIRPGYIGILNYSVFGWIEGLEKEMITCHFSAISGWPVYSTIAPKELPERNDETVTCSNYYQLADGQTMMGPAFQVRKFNGPVPLYVSSYADEGREYLEDVGWWGVESMKILKDYFGDIPFTHYTIVRQYLHLLDSAGTTLAMEHMNSATFTGRSAEMLTAPVDTAIRFRRMFGILHHMGHSYLPLRCYGDNYRPYVMTMAPVIRNIWFNEGFIWFLCLDTLKSPALLKRLEDNTLHADPEIAALSLFALSEIASTQYGSDFRIGQATFSRGAMMAREMNEQIIRETGGKKSMKDALRYVYEWSRKNRRPFTMEEFPKILTSATGVDVTGIYEKWRK